MLSCQSNLSKLLLKLKLYYLTLRFLLLTGKKRLHLFNRKLNKLMMHLL